MALSNLVLDFLGPGPYPFPLGTPEFDAALGLYYGHSVGIIRPRVTFMEQSEIQIHAHDTYEFTIAFAVSPLLRQGGATIKLPVGQILPCNPGQLHGPAERITDTNFLAIQIRREFLQDIGQAMKLQRGVHFPEVPFVPSRGLSETIFTFLEEHGSPRRGARLILEALEVQIAVHMLRQGFPVKGEDKRRQMCTGHRNILRAMEFMRAHLADEFSSDVIAHHAHMSRYHFFRSFKAQTGKTPYQYLTEVRIEKAQELLLDLDLTVNDVCYRIGFSSHSHFSTVFRKRVGITPTEYRRTHRLSAKPKR